MKFKKVVKQVEIKKHPKRPLKELTIDYFAGFSVVVSGTFRDLASRQATSSNPYGLQKHDHSPLNCFSETNRRRIFCLMFIFFLHQQKQGDG